MKKILPYILLILLPLNVKGQFLPSHSTGSRHSGLGSGEIFNPFQKDTTKSEDLIVPEDIHQWHIDELLGDVLNVEPDTMPHAFQNWHMTEGMTGEYNFLGNMGTPRQSRIFFNRPSSTEFDMFQPYDYFITKPGELFFTDTKSPYTNLSYHESGDKVTGDDRVRAYFATNAGKHFGVGFLFDYLYGRGQYDNQSTAFMNFSLFSYYRSDKYNYHMLASRYHIKAAENGGITNDEYITNPENTDGNGSNFGSDDIPVNFNKTWNRNEAYTAYFTHHYNFGFYKKVAKDISNENIAGEVNKFMQERSRKELPATAADSLSVKEFADSIMSLPQRSYNDEEYENRFIQVARITHTADFLSNRHEFKMYELPKDYFADTYMRYDSLDRTDQWSIKNTFALSLREGFSKWAIADVTAYISHKYSNYKLPDTIPGTTLETKKSYSEHTVMAGGIIQSTRNDNFKYKLRGETAISGDDLGAFLLEGNSELRIKLLKQNIKIEANAFIKNNRPSFYYRHFHSEHYWWDNDDLEKEFRSHIEGSLSIDRWKTKIKLGFENIKNYTYIANISKPHNDGFLNKLTVAQESDNIQIMSASLSQKFKLGILHFDTELTYQTTSKKEVLPLPKLNAYANLYIKFKIAKVLHTELGADAYYFTAYDAPEYSAPLGQFVQQNQQDKVEIGNYPVVNLYANFLLKKTRFYVKYYHANEGMGNMNYFLAPHQPLTPATLWLGLSWNFYN